MERGIQDLKLLILFFFLIFIIISSELRLGAVELPAFYRKWLEEEVVYIITPLEREVFLKLKTDRERDLFIEAFWKQRDPTPGTTENEFKKEHYRRLNYSTHFFGRRTPKPGWKTDRGRMYILLCEPNDIQRFEGKSQTYPVEIWFYQGKTDLGFPPGFNLVFFQERGSGEYRLYSPSADGPQALMTSYWGDRVDYLKAYQELKEIEPVLAEVSLSLIPGEGSPMLGRPSLSSDLLIQKLETISLRQVKESYAQKFLEYKDIVEVEYSTNYISCDSLVSVIRSKDGLYFVHYAIEPERLSVGQSGDKFSTHLKLYGSLVDIEGRTVYQFEKEIPLEFTQEQIREISHRPLSLRDLFPLIPGRYKFSVLVKNEVSKEFTSLEREISTPEDELGLQMSPLLLGYGLKSSGWEDRRLRPFQIGDSQIFLQANHIFLRQDELIVGFQVCGLSEELKKEGELRYIFYKENEEYKSFSKKISDYESPLDFVEKFSLDEFLPAHYTIVVSLLFKGQRLVEGRSEFDVTHLEKISRPWVYSKVLPNLKEPIYSFMSFMLGTQLFNCGQIEKARCYLEDAASKNQGSVEFSIQLARVYLLLNEEKKVVALLLPFVESDPQPKYEALFLLATSYKKTGALKKAIEILEKGVLHYGINSTLLNEIGECQLELGNVAEALEAFEKSLEINPDQPKIKSRIEALKEKK